VKAATHSKTVSAETSEAVIATPAVEFENPHDAIARLAYSFWEARGQQGGSAAEDWLRAEREFSTMGA